MGDSVLEFREFKSFEVRFFENCHLRGFTMKDREDNSFGFWALKSSFGF